MSYNRLFSVGLVCMLISITSHEAFAQDTQQLLDRASKRYAELEIEDAIRLLDQAYREKNNTAEQLIRIYHLRGLCHGALGRYKLSKRDFANLLALDPAFRLGSDVSPRIRRPFDELVRKNPQRIKVRVLPPARAIVSESLVVVFQVDTNPHAIAKQIKVFFRRGASNYSVAQTKVTGTGEHRITIPAVTWMLKHSQQPLSWYAMVEGEYASQLVKFGDALHPFSLEVVDKIQFESVASSSAWYKRWWVWTIIGGVAVAAAVSIPLAVKANETPSGPFDFTIDFTTAGD